MYEKRIGRYLSYTRVEIPALQGTASLSHDEIKEKEGELILKKIRPGDRVVLLDEKGRRFTSVAWAAHLGKMIDTGTRSLVFVIGGAYGFSDRVKEAASELVSLSDMTFPIRLSGFSLKNSSTGHLQYSRENPTTTNSSRK